MSAKKNILPFFIPMEGCKHNCIFCDQRQISGRIKSPTPAEIRAELALFSLKNMEIAFYGGSFTGLSKEKQLQYLQAVNEPNIKKQRAIRISTRPDCINQDNCFLLKGYGVKTVELGVQSFNNEVLLAAGRGYKNEVIEPAVRLLREFGFSVGIQLMTGLPEQTKDLSLFDARQAAEMADFVRIYPTVVIENTPLAELYRRGLYEPQTVEEAVDLAARMLVIFQRRQIAVIRLGLNPDVKLAQAVLAGPYHPAFGHLVYSRLKLWQALVLLQRAGNQQKILCPKADLPLLIGHKAENKKLLLQSYPLLKIVGDQTLPTGALSADGVVLLYKEFLQGLGENNFL